MKTIECELAVVGAGMAGMAASLFAAKRGLKVVQVGRPVGFTFASGLLDLMAVHPVAEGKIWEDPWGCVEALIGQIPEHPYAKSSKDDMRTALTELDSFLKAAGIDYRSRDGLNAEVITAAGTVKQSFKIPRTMWAGVGALEKKRPCLIVDFQGLREFSARQIASVAQKRWPNLRTLQIPFPGNADGHEVMTGEISAMTIAQPENIEILVRAIRPHIRDAELIGIPAILGLANADSVVMNLEDQLGTKVFEIPTGPPSVPGLRLLEAFVRQLPLNGVHQLLGCHVQAVTPQPDGGFLLEVGSGSPCQMVRSQGIILATGRFMGNGLKADRSRSVRRSLICRCFNRRTAVIGIGWNSWIPWGTRRIRPVLRLTNHFVR